MESENPTGPVVTVITVVYNAEATLEATMLSVLAQDWPQMEYLVIDGGSTDGTLDIIRRHSARLGGWVSERDRGIYDAMNKGIRVAKGEWIHFLNAGDRFASPNVLTRCMQTVRPGDGAIYGDCLIEYNGFRRRVEGKGPEHLPLGLPFSHQAVLIRREAIVNSGFDLGDGTAADYGMIARLRRDALCFRYAPVAIAIFQAGGISDTRRLSSLWHTWIISYRCFGLSLKPLLHFATRLTVESLKSMGKRLIGDRVMDRLRTWKYRDHHQPNIPS
jgi:glycosyltransferase involved in cell wall biosynthesis